MDKIDFGNDFKKYIHGRFEETSEDKIKNDGRECAGTYCGAILNKEGFIFTKNNENITCPGCIEMLPILNKVFPFAAVKIEN